MKHYIARNQYGSDTDPGPVNTWEVYECSRQAQRELLSEGRPDIRKATPTEIRRYRRGGVYNPFFLHSELEA